MANYDNILQITTPRDELSRLSTWMRVLRQRKELTIEELSARSGVPMSTISRLERTGLASTEVLFKVLFALKELVAVDDFLKVRQRECELPRTLREDAGTCRVVKRVRHKAR